MTGYNIVVHVGQCGWDHLPMLQSDNSCVWPRPPGQGWTWWYHCWPGVDMTGWQHSLRCRRGLWRGQESSYVTNSKYNINYLIVVHIAVWSCWLLVWHGADSARWHHSFTAQQSVVRSSYRGLVTGDCSDQNITTSPPSHPSLVWWQHWQLELETNLR